MKDPILFRADLAPWLAVGIMSAALGVFVLAQVWPYAERMATSVALKGAAGRPAHGLVAERDEPGWRDDERSVAKSLDMHHGDPAGFHGRRLYLADGESHWQLSDMHALTNAQPETGVPTFQNE